MSVLLSCMFMYHVHAVPMEARREHWIPLEQELETFFKKNRN